LRRGTKSLFIVVVATAFVMTPLVMGGIFLGLYLGSAVGYSGSILAIAFSTVGFVVGMFVIFRIIRAVVAWTAESSR
jgi:hypothetical protein